jgi:hypothetical protein
MCTERQVSCGRLRDAKLDGLRSELKKEK